MSRNVTKFIRTAGLPVIAESQRIRRNERRRNAAWAAAVNAEEPAVAEARHVSYGAIHVPPNKKRYCPDCYAQVVGTHRCVEVRPRVHDCNASGCKVGHSR